MADLVDLIKKAALDCIAESKPSGIYFGIVIKEKPLEIQVEQKLILSKEFLILTKNVLNYDIEVKIDIETDKSKHNHNYNDTIQNNPLTKTTSENIHSHKINDTIKITISNELKKGDKVIMLRQQGGQKYIVLDKIIC